MDYPINPRPGIHYIGAWVDPRYSYVNVVKSDGNRTLAVQPLGKRIFTEIN
jgi:hypothetical protein